MTVATAIAGVLCSVVRPPDSFLLLCRDSEPGWKKERLLRLSE